MDWLTPADPEELSGLLASRAEDPAPLLPTGAREPPPAVADPAGTGVPALAADGAVVSTSALAGLRDLRPRDLTVAAGAGTRVADLLTALAEEGVWVPLGGPALGMSAGGMAAAAPAGPFDPGHGDLKRQLLACGIVAWDGEPLRWGRAVMKDVAGYSMVRSVAGSFGRTGVVHRVTLRLWPAPEALAVPRLAPDGGTDGAADPLGLAGELATSDADATVRPDAAVWSWSPGGSAGGRLEVRLAGSGASVALRLEKLRAWAGERGGELDGGGPAAFDPLVAGGAGEKGENGGPGTAAGKGSARDPAVSVVALRTGRTGFEAAARRVRRVLGDAAAALEGYPLGGHLRCAYRRDAASEGPATDAALGSGGGPGPSAPLGRLLDAAGDAAVRVERGTAAELEAVDARRGDGARRLEARVLAELGGRPRHWLSAYL